MSSSFFRFYQRLVMGRPWGWLAVILAVSLAAGWQLRNFHLDASSESLMLENDQALDFYREISKRYGGSDFLVVTWTPEKGDLFQRDNLLEMEALRDELATLDRVDSVTSMLDVPLLFSPRTTFADLASDQRTILDEGVDLDLARKEFTDTNPLYRKLLTSQDGKTAAMLLSLKRDERFFELLYRRDDLREKAREGDLDDKGEERLEQASQAFSRYNTARQEREAEFVERVRGVLDQHRDHARIFLGGVPMIAADMVSFVRSDLQTFGIGVLLFILVSLLVIFRQPRWAVFSLACCGLVTLWVSGLLGFMGWKVTVISSNYVSLLLIITMSITIHLIVRFRELQQENPQADQHWLVRETVRHMARPSIYMILTTMVGFASLVVSDIRPVIDFGWMMTIGIGLALVLCYLLFPAFLMTLQPAPVPASRHDFTGRLTRGIASFTERYRLPVLVAAALLAVLAVSGMFRLTVENRFIDYFRDNTEIHQGMLLIDRKLGGTTPLDIVINAPKGAARQEQKRQDDPFADPFADAPAEDSFADPFADPFADGAGNDQTDSLENAYWYTPARLELLTDIQNWLQGLPETGKVLSLASTYEAASKLNGAPLSYVQLMLLSTFIPEELRNQMVKPFLSEDGNQVRLMVRIVDSMESLQRDELLKRIKRELPERFDLEPEQVRLTGAMVLYNNMLQSLFDSQIKTLGLVFLAILAMLLVLLRSFAISLIALVPSMLSASLVLGIMGWAGLPLDLMTITIAAITVGIAVDDSIHYIHRFREEFPKDRDYAAAMKRCHNTIGKAMYYTSITIIAGFSILVLSNFVPTIYFGLLTGLAMGMALLCNLALLPALLITVKPKVPALPE